MNSSVAYALYNLLLLPFYPLLFAYTLWRRYVQRKSAASFRGQWGSVPPEAAGLQGKPVVWIHAVSVGETMAARPIMRALKQEMPQCRIVLSCTTDTGWSAAQAAQKAGEVEAVFYYPIDLPWPVARALNAVRPDVFLSVETELWPNFLHIAKTRGIKCFLVNGRVSDSLLNSAPRLKLLWRWILSSLHGILMRGDYDAERMKMLCARTGAGTATQKIRMLGDVKLDEVATSQGRATERAKWRTLLGVAENELLWICGSTHPGIKENESSEEALALQIYQELREHLPLRLMLAPRHIERVDEVAAICEKAGVKSVRRRRLEGGTGEAVLILDTVGELSEIYAAADVVFIGGSLVSRGGHNILEPVLRGVPVLFGPHMHNFRSSAQFVENEKLGKQVRDADELKEHLQIWLTDGEMRSGYWQRARNALKSHQGAARRIAQHVAGQVKSKG